MNFQINLLKFADTIHIGKLFLLSVGMDPYPENAPPTKRMVQTNLFFEAGLWNLRSCELFYVIYLYLAIKNSMNFMDATISLPCLICCILSDFKVTLLRRKRVELKKILEYLNDVFPIEETEQDYYELAKVQRATRMHSIVLAVGVSLFIWSFNLLPLIDGIIAMLFYDREFTYPLPYHMWHPFRTDRIIAYVGVNIHLLFAGYVVAQYYIGVDALLFTITNQICMHFNYISKRFRDYHVTGQHKDAEFLKEIVQRHDELLNVGMDPYPVSIQPNKQLVRTGLFFEAGLWNLRSCQLFYVIYLYLAIKNSMNVMDATTSISLPCLICCVLSDFKVTQLRKKGVELKKVLGYLNDVFPIEETEQDYYGLAKVHRATRIHSIVLAVSVSMFMWSFNLVPLIDGIVGLIFFDREFMYPLPYQMWHPFRTDRIGAYIGAYIHLLCAAFAVAHYYIGADVLLLTITNQICMHFYYISKRLRDNHPKGDQKDLEFLKEIVQRHDELLKMCECTNAVFTNSIFFNFLASASIICLVTFRVTVSDFSADLVKFIIYLITMIVQIFILCMFGDSVIQASTAVAQAVYEHDWYAADKPYKQGMILIMQRAQKPTVLTASYFSIASLHSFKEVMTTSYQLFAVLHTMYSKQ